MPRQPREWLVLNLLQSGWDSANTFGLTPDISFGWWDDEKSQPQITIAMPDEGPVGGGMTGYDALNQDGSPHQTIDGLIVCHCWARDRDLGGASTDYARQYWSGDADGSNPGGLDELARIIQGNANQPTDPNTGNSPVTTLAPGTFSEVPEPDPGDEVVHFRAEVQYTYSR